MSGGSDPITISMSAAAFSFAAISIMREVFNYLRKKNEVKKAVNGNKNGSSITAKDNPHVSFKTYAKDIEYIREQLQYRKFEIKEITGKLEGLENIIGSVNHKVNGLIMPVHDLVRAHPDENITNVKLVNPNT